MWLWDLPQNFTLYGQDLCLEAAWELSGPCLLSCHVCAGAKHIIKALPLCFSSYFIAFYCSRCLQLCIKEGLGVHCASSSTGKQTVTSRYDSANVWSCKEQGGAWKGDRVLSPTVVFFHLCENLASLKQKKKRKIIVLSLEGLFVACGWTLLNARAAVRLNTCPWWPWRCCIWCLWVTICNYFSPT